MAIRIIFSIVGVVLGIVLGMMFMMALHIASTFVYPLPEGVSMFDSEPENAERLMEFFRSAPTGVWLLAIASHGLGCMFGASVATFVSGRRSLIPPLIIGVFFTVGGVMNLQQIPHPSWVPFVDLPIYIILALVAGLLLKRKSEQVTSTA